QRLTMLGLKNTSGEQKKRGEKKTHAQSHTTNPCNCAGVRAPTARDIHNAQALAGPARKRCDDQCDAQRGQENQNSKSSAGCKWQAHPVPNWRSPASPRPGTT